MKDNSVSSYRVTDLPQLTDLNGRDLFLITHSKDTGGYESQSIPFNRLMHAVKRRGFRDEISVLNQLYVDAARRSDVSAEALIRNDRDLSVMATASGYTDEQIAKIHTHGNLSILSGITGTAVSQWDNDAGYLTAHQSLSGYATKSELSDEAGLRKRSDDLTLSAAKAYTDSEMTKIHTHGNLNVLSAILDSNVSHWENDSGYLTSADFGFGYAAGMLSVQAGAKTMSVDIRDFVGDAQLSVMRDGVVLGTFGANQSANAMIEIPVGLTYDHVLSSLSGDGYGRKTIIRVWED